MQHRGRFLQIVGHIEVIRTRQLRGSVRFRIDRVGYAAIVNKLVPGLTRFAGSSVPAEASLPDAKGDCL